MDSEAAIVLSLGSGAKDSKFKGFASLRHINGKTILVDPMLTWAEAIEAKLGVKLHPNVYYVRRTKHTKTRLRFRPLTEQIFRLLTEDYFRAKDGIYYVSIYRRGPHSSVGVEAAASATANATATTTPVDLNLSTNSGENLDMSSRSFEQGEETSQDNSETEREQSTLPPPSIHNSLEDELDEAINFEDGEEIDPPPPILKRQVPIPGRQLERIETDGEDDLGNAMSRGTTDKSIWVRILSAEVAYKKKHNSSAVASPELTPIHDKPALLRLDLAWQDAFAQNFGVQLDPDRFYMRRFLPSSRQKKITLREHDIREPIRDILSEYTKKKITSITILIVDRSGPPLPPSAYAVNNRPTLVVSTTTRNKRQRSAPKWMREETQIRRGRPAKVVKGVSTFQPSLPDDDHESDDQMDVHVDVETMETNIGSIPATMTKPKVAMTSTSRNRGNNASMDSEWEDLEENFDSRNFKKRLYNKAKQISNSQLLLVMRELRELKESSKDAKKDEWTRWNMECPLPALIVRNLFDL